MTRKEIEHCWKKSRHWKWGVYYCKADPRVIVPKRIKWLGWTVNFAHPRAIPAGLCLAAIAAVPLLIVTVQGAGMGIKLIAGAASLTVLCRVCAYLSSRTE